MYMRVISRRPLNELAKRYPEAKVELDAWFHEAEAARWGNPAQIKEQYGSASILKGSRVVFNRDTKNYGFQLPDSGLINSLRFFLELCSNPSLFCTSNNWTLDFPTP